MPKRKDGWIPKEQRSTLICKDCKEELPIAKFQRHGTSASGLQQYSSRCTICENIHADKHWKCRSESQEKIRLVDQLKVGCSRCGYNVCKRALDFHHKDEATKLFGVSSARVINVHTIDELLAEIQKCVVLCANCHREYHAGVWALAELV